MRWRPDEQPDKIFRDFCETRDLSLHYCANGYWYLEDAAGNRVATLWSQGEAEVFKLGFYAGQDYQRKWG